jgi:hypothetical protein
MKLGNGSSGEGSGWGNPDLNEGAHTYWLVCCMA